MPVSPKQASPPPSCRAGSQAPARTPTASSKPKYRKCWYHCCTSGRARSHSCRLSRLRPLRNSLALLSGTAAGVVGGAGAETRGSPPPSTEDDSFPHWGELLFSVPLPVPTWQEVAFTGMSFVQGVGAVRAPAVRPGLRGSEPCCPGTATEQARGGNRTQLLLCSPSPGPDPRPQALGRGWCSPPGLCRGETIGCPVLQIVVYLGDLI